MKIMYIITLSEIGGAQVHLIELITCLPKNITVCVVVGEEGWLTWQLESQGVTYQIEKSLVREISPIKDICAIISLCKKMKKWRPDLVHCHSSKAGIIGRIAANIMGIPAIFTAHGWAFTEGVSRWEKFLYRHLEKKVARLSKRILCVSDYDRNLALKAMPHQKDKLITIHNGIHDNEQIREKSKNEQNCFRIVMTARFSKPKDYNNLLKALAQLKEKNIPFYATLIGDGPDLKIIKEQAEQLHIEKNIWFAGARVDVEKILQIQDVCVLISKWEGLPISILEGMRQGLPIVATDVGGVSEAVKENGYLISRGDVKRLTECLMELHYKKALREYMGNLSRKKYEMEFTSNIMGRKIVGVYQDVMRGIGDGSNR